MDRNVRFGCQLRGAGLGLSLGSTGPLLRPLGRSGQDGEFGFCQECREWPRAQEHQHRAPGAGSVA